MGYDSVACVHVSRTLSHVTMLQVVVTASQNEGNSADNSCMCVTRQLCCTFDSLACNNMQWQKALRGQLMDPLTDTPRKFMLMTEFRPVRMSIVNSEPVETEKDSGHRSVRMSTEIVVIAAGFIAYYRHLMEEERVPSATCRSCQG